MVRFVIGSFLFASLAACSGTSGQTLSVAQIRQNLDASFGGYTTALEKPNFDDSAVLAIPKLESSFASQATAAGSSSAARSFRVALLWGHFPAANADTDADTDATPATWSGSVSVDMGAIEVERTLSFDGDSVAPRDDPRVVSFVSHTLPYVDGLLLHVVVTGDQPNAVLHFATSELTTDVQLDVVAQGAGTVVHAGGDQGLAVVGWSDTGQTCPGGFAYGRWVKIDGGVGTLRARLVSAAGEDGGVAEGIWGTAPKSKSDVFFGKSIDGAGKFGALVEGVYKDGEIHGTRGDDVSQNGSFVGVYSDGHDDDQGRGVFLAKWMGTCSPI